MTLSQKELQDLYSNNYFMGQEYQNYAQEAPALRKNFQRRLDSLHTQAENNPTLFEIGSAYGYFLDVARQFFTVSGCDISSHACEQAVTSMGLDVRCGDYLDFAPPPAPFHVICLWDTVEHLQSPDLYLEKAHAELADNGTLALSTGDISALLPRLQGKHWRLIHPPSHLHYFTARSIKTLLQRLGYNSIKITYPAFWRSAEAVAYRLIGVRFPRLFNTIKSTGMLNFYFPINTRDLMTVTARK